MFNLLEMFWEWKKSKIKLKTELGFKVKCFGVNQYAVHGEGYSFRSLNDNGSWTIAQYVGQYCVGSREEIEAKFGKILGLDC